MSLVGIRNDPVSNYSRHEDDVDASALSTPLDGPSHSSGGSASKLVNAMRRARANVLRMFSPLRRAADRKSRSPESTIDDHDEVESQHEDGEFPDVQVSRQASVLGNFVRDEEGVYFERGTGTLKSLGEPAFSESENLLKTKKEDEKTVMGMVELARRKGWSSIDVNGTDEFKKQVVEAARKFGIEVNLSRADSKKMVGNWIRRDDPGASENRTPEVILAGHGKLLRSGAMIEIPEGTSISFYAPHGAKISDQLGSAIERGEDVSHLPRQTFGPGEMIPEYVLLPPENLAIENSSKTVDRATSIRMLLKPNMGDVRWAACVFDENSPFKNMRFGMNGVFDADSSKYITTYPISKAA